MKFQELTQLIEQNEGSMFISRNIENRGKQYEQLVQRQIQEYIRNGSVGNLVLYGDPIKHLPNNLTKVGGYLNLGATPIKSLTPGLKIGKWLGLHNTPLETLPDGLEIGTQLDIASTPIKSLPADIKVGMTIYLINTLIEELPTNFKVNGSLNLLGSPIKSLPEGLYVKNNLIMDYTQLSYIPQGIHVGGDLELFNTPLSKEAYNAKTRKELIDIILQNNKIGGKVKLV